MCLAAKMVITITKKFKKEWCYLVEKETIDFKYIYSGIFIYLDDDICQTAT